MPLPDPDKFRIKDLAKRWNITEEDVREYIRAGHFKELIIYEERTYGPFIRHFVIDDKVPPTPVSLLPIHLAKPSHSSMNSMRLWLGSIHSIIEFPWPSEGMTLYIPKQEVEAFEKENNIGHGPKCTSLKAAEIDGHAVSKTPAQGNEQSWIPIARTIGREIALKHPKLNLEQIAEKVRTQMLKKKEEGNLQVTGRGGRLPFSATIKRRALKRIRGDNL